jgi:SAM-dependent methyltransferase
MDNIKDDRGYNQIWAINKATRVRAERRCDYLISRMALPPCGKILEIGCGLGTNAFMVAKKTGADVLGTDLCVQFVRGAQERYRLPNLRYEVLDVNRAHQLEGETFDYILGNGILHHLYRQLDDVFVNLSRLLNAGGRVVFFEPNIYNPYIYLIFTYPWLRRRAHLEPDEMAFSRRFVTTKLHEAGYRNIHVEFRDFLLPGIPSFLIRPSILIGALLERIPLVNYMAQSIFISAVK